MFDLNSFDKHTALVVIDMQNDFAYGGALAVPEADEIIPDILKLIEAARVRGSKVVFSIDSHTPDNISFASNHEGAKPFDVITAPYGQQTLWPDHCVRGTWGQKLVDPLNSRVLELADIIITKGSNPKVDSYSAFFENDGQSPTGLEAYLGEVECDRVILCGLAYDYCVAASAMDAAKLGFKVTVIKNLTKSINTVNPDGRTSVETVETDFENNEIKVREVEFS
jgi:nicotinamidase/pyrazinamidase